MKRLAHAASVVCAACLAISAGAEARQRNDKQPAVSKELTGCVSVRPAASGEFTIVDSETGGAFRLSGRGIQKYAGRHVTVEGSPPTNRLGFRFGLWPSPNTAAQAGALDPAQESISRQPGGGTSSADSSRLPELRVQRIRIVGGSCD
jgi:hypothetical protein